MEWQAVFVPSKKKPKHAYHHGDLRTALLDAAIVLIEKHGLAALSLRECARKVGVSHAAPTRHFANKAALLHAIAQKGFAELVARGIEAMKDVRDPRDRADAYGEAYVRFAFENPVLFRVMFTTEDDAHAPKPSADATSPAATAFGLLVDASRRSLGEKEVTPDVMTAALASWSIVHGLSMLILDRRISRQQVPDGDAAQSLARAVLAMFRGTLAKTRR